MNLPEELRYTKEHEWIRLDAETGTVGITDYAQGELGDIVFVELPAKGRAIRRGESMGTIEAVKAVSDLYAPVSGEVVEVNPELASNSELVNKDPYGKGWMIRVRLSDRKELDALLDAAGYRTLIGK